MGVFKLQLEDFNTAEYELIAIHTTIEVTKLAYLLNKNLETRFYFFGCLDKTENKEKGSFDCYLFKDEEKELSWNLLQNKSIIKGGELQNSFFEQFEQTMYLIPEYRKADYILKIEIENDSFESYKVIQALSKINTITMSYLLDKNKIKSKSNLIF